MEQTWTVTQLNQTVKKWLESEFSKIWIEGEISNFKKYPSGHMYFSLKDEKSGINCVMFIGTNRLLKFTPKNGLQVKLRAKVSLYPDRGQFQLIVDFMEEAGDGALKRAFELLQKQLKSEGLFDNKHKKSLPSLPQQIGIITSAKGAAVRDILTTLKRRFPSIPVIIYPALVQGNLAANDIKNAIEKANLRQECDVLIIGRGGGSLEDLQAFNEAIVARAIFASDIPIISAVGHEVDFTISDFVADVRAPTPTGAAEIVSPSREQFESHLLKLMRACYEGMLDKIEDSRSELYWLRKTLKDPRQQLLDKMQRLDDIGRRLVLSISHYQKHRYNQLIHLQQNILRLTPLHQINSLQQQMAVYEKQMTQAILFKLKTLKQQLNNNIQLLDSLSPLQILTRGYAMVKDDKGNIITHIDSLNIGDKITTRLSDGEFSAVIDEKL